MTRFCLVVALVLGLARFLSAAGDDKDKKNELEGTWKLLKVDQTGKAKDMTEKSSEFFHMKIAGNKLTNVFNNGSEEATFQLGTAKDVKTITITPTTGDDQGKTILGIYQLKGNELTLAVGEAGSKDRPTGFKGASKKVSVFYLKRAELH